MLKMAGQDELVLLERVFLRIGSAESDEQLEVTLGKFLAPVLLKLTSTQDGVRKKVMELLVHVNKRLKSRSQVQLPVDALMVQYQDPACSPFITNFTILYIKMGYPRLPVEKQAELVPTLVHCLEGRPLPQQDSLLQMLMPVLTHVKFPSDPEKRRAMFGLEERPQTTKLLLDYMLDVLLLPYNLTAPNKDRPASAPAAPTQSVQGASTSGACGVAEATGGPPPGLSEQAYKRVVGDTPPKPDVLEKMKCGILSFLGADLFADDDVVIHYMVACSDTRHSVATAADMELKRIVGSIDWNNPVIVAKIYSLLRGTVKLNKEKAPAVKPDQKRSPAGTRLKMKLFPYLLKSREAASVFPACIQVIFGCLFGSNTNQKLKLMAVQFVHHVCLHCQDAKFTPTAPVLLPGMITLIGEAKDDPKLRSLAYVAVGKIARRMPQLITKDLGIVQTFFDAMSVEESDTKLAVQESLAMMSEAFKSLDGPNLKLMEALIMQNIEKDEPQARMMAVQYANVVFPPDHIPSRYVLLLACGDIKEDIYNEASKYLKAITKQEKESLNENTKLMPSFTELVQYINEKAQVRVKTEKKYTIGNSVLPFNPGTCAETLVYMRMCLAYNAGVKPDIESLAAMQEQAPVIAKYVKGVWEVDKTEKGPVQIYIKFIQQLLTAIGGAPAMYCLTEIVAIAYAELATQFAQQLPWIQKFVLSMRDDIREYASQLYGIVVAHGLGKIKMDDQLKELIKNTKDKSLEGQHGSLLALGYLIGRIYSHSNNRLGDVTMEDIEEKQEPTKDNDNVTLAVKQIASFLDNSHQLLVTGACVALGEVGRCGKLPLPVGEVGSSDSQMTLYSVVDKLVKKLNAQKEPNKVREKAAMCLGHLCVGDVMFPHRQKILEGLLECAQAKQYDLHFPVGEALVCAALGPLSPDARDVWLEQEEEFKVSSDSKDQVNWLVLQLLTKHVTSDNPHIRQAACIWLLAVVKKCGKHQAVQEKLKDVQAAFMSLLSEKDELIQDIASKGLGVVYENCTKEQKDEMVAELVQTLMTGKRPSQQITGDTKVFEEGALGKTPSGEGLSTYKELCAIATDLNQPDLIYKFMHLANHQAAWNSRKGAAFGFTTIAAQAGEQLAPYLPKIVPRLYRYQFDPNPKIQMAMSSIWQALVSDNKKTVDQYLKEIVGDLIKNLTSNQWRVRESSCHALSDLLRGRRLDDVIDQIPVLWEICLRVLDDVKESVRKAADIAVKTLSKVSIKICDIENGKVGERAISLVVPCLLKNGLNSQVEEVRGISLTTIVKISKNAGPLLKPHVPLLVTALLEALSTLEPQMLNYLTLRVSANQQAVDKLDSARIAASKMSPMMETVTLCVQYVDDTVLPELIPRLTELIRSGIGLGTKAGCSGLIISLCQHCPRELAQYAGKLMSALLAGLGDKSAAIRKAYANSMSHVVKVAKDSSVEKLVTRLKGWYLEKEDEASRSTCGVTLHAINQNAPDIFKRHAALVLPLTFLAMHEKKKTDAAQSDSKPSLWDDIWFDNTPGTEGGVRLYLQELVQISQTALESQSWHMKAQGASAMSTIASKLGATLGPPHLGLVLKALLIGLSGRTWPGKESLLNAVKEVCVSCKTAIEEKTSEEQPSLQEIIDAIMKEFRKENISYKLEALKCLAAILETYEVDKFQEVSDILYPLLQINKKNKDDEDEDHGVFGELMANFRETGFESLGMTWPKVKETQDTHQVKLWTVLSSALPSCYWKQQVSILKAMKKVLTKLLIFQDKENISNNKDCLITLTQQSVDPLCECLGNIKYSAVRTEALDVTEKILTQLNDVDQLNIISNEHQEKLAKTLEGMSEESLPVLKDKAADLRKLLPNSG